MLVHSDFRLLGLLAAAAVVSIGDLATEARADGDSNAEILADFWMAAFIKPIRVPMKGTSAR